jgi:hypothetical protein
MSSAASITGGLARLGAREVFALATAKRLAREATDQDFHNVVTVDENGKEEWT